MDEQGNGCNLWVKLNQDHTYAYVCMYQKGKSTYETLQLLATMGKG